MTKGLLTYVEFWHLYVCPVCGSWTTESGRQCNNEDAHSESIDRIRVKVVPADE